MSQNDKAEFSIYRLLDVLEGMFDDVQIKKVNEINWTKLAKEATEDVIIKLYSFNNDTQRIGFLDYIIKKIFDHGKGHVFAFVSEGPNSKTYKGDLIFESKEDFEYARNCSMTVIDLLEEVSDHCLIYESVDLHRIIKANFCVPNIDPFKIFVIYVSGKNKNDSKALQPLSYFFEDKIKTEFIEYAKKELRGKKGLKVAVILIALTEIKALKHIESFVSLFKAIQHEAGVLGSRQSVYKYIFKYDALTYKTNSPLDKKLVDNYIVKFRANL